MNLETKNKNDTDNISDTNSGNRSDYNNQQITNSNHNNSIKHHSNSPSSSINGKIKESINTKTRK